ncbi:MAG: glycosyltransferase family 39 protein [bacterium]|nr:glycosyltransferase family 39 protein [bacterium]
MKKNHINPFTKLDIFIVSTILIVAFIFRLYKINTPLADFHSWRQVDTAAVARNYTRTGIDLFHPRYDDLSSIETGKENPNGYRFVEFPLYNAIIALFNKAVPVLPIEVEGRLVSIFFTLFTIFSLYYLSLKESDRITAIVSSLVFAIFPFFVFFTRVVLPEPTAISLVMISIMFLYISAHVKKSLESFLLIIISSILISLAILIKPTVIFYGFTILVLFIYRYKLSIIKKFSIYIYGLIAIVPFILWRSYIQKFPEGIPASDWLITSVNTYEGVKNIFFKPAFFRWIFFERLNNYILGGYLTFFFVLGIIRKQSSFILHSILISALAYLLVFQGGNVQHEYYQTLILPAVALSIGMGVSFIIVQIKSFWHPIFTYSLIVAIFLFSFFISFYKVRDYYNYSSDLTQIANIINTLTSPTDKIVTDQTGDTTLLYLMDRKGAPAIYKDPAELSKLGYNYLVTLNDGEIRTMKEQKFKVVFENNKFTLFQL